MGGRGYRKLNKFKPFDANTICDETGFKKKVSEVVKRWDGFYVIPEAWNPQQPQDFAPSISKPIFFPESRSESVYPELWVSFDSIDLLLASLNPDGWWPFKEGNGVTAFDWSQADGNQNDVGDGNNGDADEGVLSGESDTGYADFDGTTSIDFENITLNQGRAVFLYFEWDDTNGAALFCEGDIRESTTEPGGIPKGYDVTIYDGGSETYGITVTYYNSDTDVFKAVNFNAFDFGIDRPDAGDNTYLAVIFSGTNPGDTISVYLSGVDGETPIPMTLIGQHTIEGKIQNSALPRKLGNSFAGDGYTGEMNHFMIFDRAPTEADLVTYQSGVQQYRSTVPVPP